MEVSESQEARIPDALDTPETILNRLTAPDFRIKSSNRRLITRVEARCRFFS